jgi:uncharacterized protein (DUF433 family)
MIISDPNIMLGKPVIEGTRVTVEVVLEKLAAGLSHKDILVAYPRLTEKDIIDVVAFANRSTNNGTNRFAKYRGVGLGKIKTKKQMMAWLKKMRGREDD